MQVKTRALFLDRDGVINEDVGFAHAPEQIRFMPGIFDLVRAAHQEGDKIIVITNQSGIGRGLYSEEQFHTLMKWMLAEFEKHGAPITAYYYCPHHPDDGCACRKPKPGMILQAAKEWNIDLGASHMIGDKATDEEAAKASGIGSFTYK